MSEIKIYQPHDIARYSQRQGIHDFLDLVLEKRPSDLDGKIRVFPYFVQDGSTNFAGIVFRREHIEGDPLKSKEVDTILNRFFDMAHEYGVIDVEQSLDGALKGSFQKQGWEPNMLTALVYETWAFLRVEEKERNYSFLAITPEDVTGYLNANSKKLEGKRTIKV